MSLKTEFVVGVLITEFFHMLFVWIWFVILTDRFIKSSSKNTSNQSKALFINFLYILHNTRKVFLRHQKESGFKPIYDYHQWRMFGHKITRRFLSPSFFPMDFWRKMETLHNSLLFLAMLLLWCQKFGAAKKSIDGGGGAKNYVLFHHFQ